MGLGAIYGSRLTLVALFALVALVSLFARVDLVTLVAFLALASPAAVFAVSAPVALVARADLVALVVDPVSHSDAPQTPQVPVLPQQLAAPATAKTRFPLLSPPAVWPHPPP